MFEGNPAALIRDDAEYAGKTLFERATGKFYTPDALASDLAVQMLVALGDLPPRFTLCDPFCGDGQLISAFLFALAERSSRPQLEVTLLDLDGGAVQLAASRVRALASELDLGVTIRKRVGDSFSASSAGSFDAIITNPPWELLKPDSRETAGLSEEEKGAYRSWLSARCTTLDTQFPEARADVSWAGWGTNLARCGWALALRSCRPGGVVGIVLPGTLMGDQASASMRRHALCTSQLLDIAAYPPEARLFAKVDQPVVAATFRAWTANPNARARVRLHDARGSVHYVGTMNTRAQELATRAFAIPVGFGAAAQEVLSSLSHFPTFRDLERSEGRQLWAGRELDETRVDAKLESGCRHPFVKGRMVQRFAVVEQPTKSVKPDIAATCASIAHARLVWRDVARASQRRRMIACLIPAHWVAGNSLHVAYFRDGDEIRLRALLAVVSSYVFEFLVRARLATGHMSLGVVRQAQVPHLCRKTVSLLSGLVEQVRLAELDHVALEVAVARSYGLQRDMFEQLLQQFPKQLPAERERLLERALWVEQ